MLSLDLVQPLVACSTCMSDAGSKTAIAANMAIFIMLACLVLVLGSIGMFIRHLGRGGKRVASGKEI